MIIFTFMVALFDEIVLNFYLSPYLLYNVLCTYLKITRFRPDLLKCLNPINIDTIMPPKRQKKKKATS